MGFLSPSLFTRFLAQIILYMCKVVNPKIANYRSRAESYEPRISIRICYGD